MATLGTLGGPAGDSLVILREGKVAYKACDIAAATPTIIGPAIEDNLVSIQLVKP